MSRRSEYYRYLESCEWRQLRKQAFERDEYKCTVCGSGLNLRGHHRRYRKDIRTCIVDDIQTMCNECHERHHREKAAERKRNRKPKQTMRHLTYILCNFDATL